MNALNIIKRTLSLCAVALALSVPVAAADKGSAAEAEAMVAKTVAYIKQVGAEKAYNEITNGTMFKDRDLLPSCTTCKARASRTAPTPSSSART